MEKSVPEDGYAKVAAQNVMIKLYFSDDVIKKETQAANKDKFEFTDSKGKKVDYKIYYDEKEPNKICILSTKELKMEKEYTLTIKGGLTSDAGQTLGANEMVKFTTKGNSGGKMYILLMVAMGAVMVLMTVRDQKKKAAEEGDSNAMMTITTNPYKLAKEKNISVEEAKALIAKEKEKVEKKTAKAKKKAQEEYEAKKAAEEAKKNIHRVQTKRVVKRK